MTEATLPPHSIAAEQAVLGALLMDNLAWEQVGDLLQPADFYVAEHGATYRAIARLVAENRPADVVTVYEATRGDLVYLNELTQSVVSVRNARAHAEVVRERSVRRQVMRLARQLLDDAQQPPEQQPLGRMLDASTAALLELQQGGRTRAPTGMGPALTEFLDDLQARADGDVRTLETGLADLDKLTAGGARRGELWVIGARPSMGKSALVLQLCRNVGRAYPVLLLSQEDSILTATQRFVAAAGNVNLADLRNPRNAPQDMWVGVTEGVQELTDLKVWVDDQTGLGLADVKLKAQQVRRQCGRLDMLVVDYLQLMDDSAGDNRNQGLGLVANGLKRMAKELDCWVVLLSQLNRKADERAGPPQMSDLRDSGDIEGAADLIGLLYREHMRKPTEENKHWAQLHVAKQKNGPTDTLSLFFDGARQRFSNWDGPPPFRSKAAGRGGDGGVA